MRRQSIFVLVTTTFLFFPIGSQNVEADLYFDDGEIHNIDYFINDDVWVDWDAPGMQTTVNLLDGGYIASALRGYNDGYINVSGGYTYTLRVHDNTQVDITGGRAQLFYAYDNTQVDITGGIVSQFAGQDNTQVDITGGSIGHWSLSQNGHTKRSGGATMAGFLTLRQSSMLTLLGSNFTVDGQAFGYGELSSINGGDVEWESFRTLTGTLADGGLINYQFRIGHEAKIVLVPAPSQYYVHAVNGNDNNTGLTPETAFATIQKGIDSAEDRDTVVVLPGIYTGARNRDIDFKGKAITVRSTDPNDPNVVAATIIDCNGSAEDPHRGFYFHSSEDANSILEGFTIINGYGPNEPFGASEYSAGGAIYCNNSSPTIRNCVINNNYSAYWGGGLHCDGSYAVIEKCTFRGNESADTGGGLYNRLSSITVNKCRFINNLAPYGGGVYNADGTPTIKNSVFSANSAGGKGGAVRNNRAAAQVVNCTFYGNSAPDGGAIHNKDSDGTIIKNSILWGNLDSEIEGPAQPTYCDIKDGCSGEGNINADPCFADAGAGDYHLKSQAGRWDPNSHNWVYDNVTSPCIDTGNPGSPLGDEPSSVHNVRVNMGAYGGTIEASKTPYGWGLLPDLTNDRIVTFEDFAGQAADWQETANHQPGDLNRDGIVDIADANLFAHSWLRRPVSIPSDMLFIPAGTFEMGDHFSEGVRLKETGYDELPVHTATLDSFYMGKYKITNKQYCEFLNDASSLGKIKVVSGIVYASFDASNSYRYCATSSAPTDVPPYSGRYSQIDYSDGVFAARTKSDQDMSNDPMVLVSWFGAAVFCNWKSKQEGFAPCYNLSSWTCDFTTKGFRLPTEAEWEYAARGGLSRKRYPWGDSIVPSQANYLYSGDPYETGDFPQTTPVGFYDGQLHQKADFNWPGSQLTYQPSSGVNGYGLYDMAANVYDWCNDWYDEGYYDYSPTNSPTGPTTGSYHVIRGGYFGGDGSYCRVSCRETNAPTDLPASLGFRLVLDLN